MNIAAHLNSITARMLPSPGIWNINNLHNKYGPSSPPEMMIETSKLEFNIMETGE